MVRSDVHRRLITIPMLRSFRRILAFAAGLFTLAIALLAPLHIASVQGDTDICFTGGAV